ncbi:hypothetical protein MHYP_G00309420 [Metynnis hypsauchen]
MLRGGQERRDAFYPPGWSTATLSCETKLKEKSALRTQGAHSMAPCVRLGQLMHKTDEEACCVDPELSVATSTFVASCEPRSCM